MACDPKTETAVGGGDAEIVADGKSFSEGASDSMVGPAGSGGGGDTTRERKSRAAFWKRERERRYIPRVALVNTPRALVRSLALSTHTHSNSSFFPVVARAVAAGSSRNGIDQ